MVIVSDTPLAATSGLAPTRVTSIRRTCGDIATVGSPITPISSAALIRTFGLLPLALERLDKGIHAIRKAVLTMTPLTPKT